MQGGWLRGERCLGTVVAEALLAQHVGSLIGVFQCVLQAVAKAGLLHPQHDHDQQ